MKHIRALFSLFPIWLTFFNYLIFTHEMQISISNQNEVKEHHSVFPSSNFVKNRPYSQWLLFPKKVFALEEGANTPASTAKLVLQQKIATQERNQNIYSQSDSGKGMNDKITHIFRVIYDYGHNQSGAYLTEANFGLMWGTVMGDDDYLSAAQKKQFALLGIQHLTAASGYNVQVLISSLAVFLPKRRSFLKTLVLSSLLFFYVGVCGFQVSLVRASLQWGISAWCSYVQRPIGRFMPLALSVFIMVCTQPKILTNIGLQLSVGATLGILLLTGRRKKERDQKISIAIIQQLHLESARKNVSKINPLQHAISLVSRYVYEVSLFSLAASIFTLPIITYHFGEFSPWFLLGNITVQWLIPWVTVASAAYIAVACLNLTVSFRTAFVFQLPAELTLFLVQSLATVIQKLQLVSGVAKS